MGPKESELNVLNILYKEVKKTKKIVFLFNISPPQEGQTIFLHKSQKYFNQTMSVPDGYFVSSTFHFVSLTN